MEQEIQATVDTTKNGTQTDRAVVLQEGKVTTAVLSQYTSSLPPELELELELLRLR